MDLLAALAAEKDAAAKAAKDTGLTPKAFAAFWSLRDEAALKHAGVDPLELGKEIEKLLARFPNFLVNADEQRQLRAALYRPLITLTTAKQSAENLRRVVSICASNHWMINRRQYQACWQMHDRACADVSDAAARHPDDAAPDRKIGNICPREVGRPVTLAAVSKRPARLQ